MAKDNDNDKSDYNKLRTNLFNMLPEAFQSDVNLSVFENTLNRFLTKVETQRVSGIIGQTNPNAIVDRQIQEPTPHRQAFQLQPILYEKIGSVEHSASWEDSKNELERLGVVPDRNNVWGNAVQFNWAPPIDIDKLIHYQDYYWVDPLNPGSLPQYITIRNKCNVATAKVSYFDRLISDFGSTYDILIATPGDSSLVVAGDLTSFMVEGFLVFIKNSTNVDLNNSFQTVASSTFDVDTQRTTIVLSDPFADATADGVVSIEEIQAGLVAGQQCQCDGTTGWDVQLWDDNQVGDVLWSDTLLATITFATEAEWILANGAPSLYDLWYDTTTNTLKQYDGVDFTIVQQNFSLIVDQIRGDALWDYSKMCGEFSNIGDTADQWIQENKWVHRNDVGNFSGAKQAEVPIIEYLESLELNEWTCIDYNWKYTASQFESFADTNNKPHLLELYPFEWYVFDIVNNELILDERYGDQTGTFSEGYIFSTSAGTDNYTVVTSRFYRDADTEPYRTRVKIAEPLAGDLVEAIYDFVIPGNSVPSTAPLIPLVTSVGDPWKNYNEHWLMVGTTSTSAINHQPINPFVEISPLAPVVDDVVSGYQYRTSPYAQSYSVTVAGVTDFELADETIYLPSTSLRSLRRRSVVGFNDVRVYVNGIRQFGNYDENTETVLPGDVNAVPGMTQPIDFVSGISFHFPVNKFDDVRIEVGEASVEELGYYVASIRLTEDNTDFLASGEPVPTSLIRYRKTEQVKVGVNQYPLFDIYNVDGTSALTANHIFGYLTSPDQPVDLNVGLRLVKDSTGTVYSFEQVLLNEDNGTLFAYRDYNNFSASYWVNTLNDEVYFWDGLTWNPRSEASGHYVEAIASFTEPPAPYKDIEGFFWYDTNEDVLKQRTIAPNDWVVVSPVNYETSDPTLQTIWRAGLNKEEYVPAYVDEDRNEITIGDENGDWEVPDQLFFNHLHENRVILTSQDLLAHFADIVEQQPLVPGFVGPKQNMFHLLDSTEINWGLGGTIKEYNDGFDTLLSSTFVNNITPPTLFEFAQDQYESSLNALVEIYRRNSLAFMLDTSDESLINFQENIAEQVVTEYEQNDAANLVYGDSTTFDDETNLGMRNWIATLPYFNIVPRVLPELSDDRSLQLNSVIHHDGHLKNYSLSAATVENIIRLTVNAPDPRTIDFTGVAQETFGRISTQPPPNDISEYVSLFSADIRDAVYWLHQPTGAPSTFYRLSAFVSISEPSISNPDGSLWMDLTPGFEVLRVKNGAVWDVVTGNAVGDGRFHNGTNPSNIATASISAWQVVDVNNIVANVILEAENKLYENAPEEFEPVFDFSSIINTPADASLYDQLLEEQFLTYVREREIVDPYESVYVADDPLTWNYKYSAPGNQYQIVDIDNVANTFDVENNVTATFTPGVVFSVKNSQLDDGMWTVVSSSFSVGTGNTTIAVVEDVQGVSSEGIIYTGALPSSQNTGGESGGIWQDLYQKIYGTAYPHLEPWKLQNYQDKPSWWDAEYLNDDPATYGTRRWKYIHSITTGMWENIRVGSVPVGQLLPDGITTSTGAAGEAGVTYSYFSVNIGDVPITSNGIKVYRSDEILPPFFDFIAAGEIVGTTNRSIFSDFSNEIVAPALAYVFEDAGPVEWEWRNASQYLYDQMIIAYKLQPMRLIADTFGVEFLTVGCLDIERRTSNTFSHARTIFHGEVQDDNTIYVANGTNQWYVNANRFAGYDTAFSDFRSLWTAWNAPLTYQFASFVNKDTFDIGSRVIPISQFDYNIALKDSKGVSDHWLHSFDVSILRTAPDLLGTNTDNRWQFSISSQSPLNQPVEYYAVNNFQFYVDVNTNICTLYRYDVRDINTTNDTLDVLGNQTEVFAPARVVTIQGSTGNDGTYEVLSSAFDAVNNVTVIELTTQIPSSVVDGTITADYRTLPWEDGQELYFTTGGILPSPLQSEIFYFLIKISDTEFQIANRPSEVSPPAPIILTSQGRGNQFVGEIASSFTTLNKGLTRTWYNYAVDVRLIKTFTPPYIFNGMQQFIDIIRGYDQLSRESGFIVNEDATSQDPDTNAIVSWQLEVERFIDFAYEARTNLTNVEDRYEVTVDDVTNTFTFVNEPPQFITGDEISFYVVGAAPTPIVEGLKYYVIRDTLTDFRVATSSTDAQSGIEVDIEPTPNQGSPIYITKPAEGVAFPTHEVNPFRLGVWFEPERGIVSNLVSGPFVDIRTEQLLFDQYGRRLSTDNVNIFRQDESTRIRVRDEVDNDVELTSVFNDPYNYIHLAGAHLFLDTYEHVLRFNDYTSEDALIYDPFIGLSISKFDVIFDRQVEFTQRPNVGGFYLLDNDLFRNIEAQVSDMREYYDTFRVSEQLQTTKHGRASLGYEGTKEYLDLMNINAKSQFVFWRGLIQNKGSINAVKAFINSKRFIDAKIDEYWALKVAEFGSVEEKEYPEMFINTTDARLNEFRMEHVRQDQDCSNVDDTFTCITLSDQERWYEWPDQLATLRDNGLGLYFDMDTTDNVTDIPANLLQLSSSGRTMIVHGFNCDAVTITFNMYTSPFSTTGVAIGGTTQNITTYIPDANMIRVYIDGIEQQLGVDFAEDSGAEFSNDIFFTTPLVGGETLEVVYTTGTLVPGIHYQEFTSSVVEIISTIVNSFEDITVWCLSENKEALNPSKVRDVISNVVVSNVPIWNPARGHHYTNATSVVNIYNNEDEAVYTNPVVPQVIPAAPPVQFDPWAQPEVGTVWMDTTNLDYVPYYDVNVFPDIEQRSNFWGELAGWGEVRLFEWTESDVPPEQWNELAATEENDVTIPESIRKSGTVRTVWVNNLSSSIIENVYDEFLVEMDWVANPTPGEYTFSLTNIGVGEIVNVYVDGILVSENVTVPSDPMPITDLNITDTVRIVRTIQQQVDDLGTDATEATPYVEIVIDDVNNPGQTISTYYFWVENKTTKPEHRLMSLSNAATQIRDIPIPYMFLQKPVLPEVVSLGVVDQSFSNQTTVNTADAAGQVLNLTHNVKDDDVANISSVTVNGIDATYVYNAVGPSITIIVDPTASAVVEDKIIRADYTTTAPDDAKLPARYVQSIVRGLRGVVNEERRYTLRFTRDFTLRDSLEHGDTPLDLKNLHAEWTLFREKQPFTIQRSLWDRITECIVGYKLSDPSVRVPSLERQLYDAEFDTDTQYGLGANQAFANGATALETVLFDLNNPDNDFSPNDINVFFQNHSFDTPENIIEAMDTIYTTFKFEDVNRIFFEVLDDSLSVKQRYPELFKTSWLSLHGIKILEVGGLFDD